MRIVGGETELLKTTLNEYFTDSGRSSIRLILEILKKKTFLVPNYICEIILKIFEEYEISFSFYKINNDLSIDYSSLIGKHYDVIYVINYFGVNHSINEIIDPSKIIVEDNVFSPLFYNKNNFPNWIGFNSFRKFSPLADGSLIKSSLTLPKDKIRNKDPEFSNIKYTAKDMKYNFLKYHRYSEKEYLDLFRIAENKLDSQTWINNISSYSLFRLFDFISGIEKEYKIRANNYNILYENLKDKAIELNTNYLSFFVLSVEKRDALRKYLFSKNIFCPIHWPSIAGVSCQISDMCLSIPIDSRYSTNDMMQIAAYVNNFYEN
jgi:hypothetical protein